MSQIVIISSDPDSREYISALKKVTGLPFGDIVSRLRTGGPIINFKLFDSSFDIKNEQLRTLLRMAEQTSAKLRIWVIPQKLYTDESNLPDHCEISAPILLNILKSAEETVLHIREQDSG